MEVEELLDTNFFVRKMLRWGKKNRRRFTWRETSNPYAVLIAEILLQRTAADQVESIYCKFIEEFPTVEMLAGASIRDIANVIKPLGLTYRAPRLKDIAVEIIDKHHGLIPESKDELLQLNGVGEYVSNAILCFAFGKDTPIIDTNVSRVVQRVFGIDFGNEPHKKKEFWKIMSKMVPKGRARDFNFSILDCAHMICKSTSPKCEKCPLVSLCRYHQFIQEEEGVMK